MNHTSPAASAPPPNAPPAPDADATFSALPGIDGQAGLKTIGGSVAMYRQMLRRLCREQVAFDIDFSGARVAADTATTRRIAHTLRGLAGTIGALQVQMAAAALEHACLRNEPDNELDALQAQVTAELDTVLAGLAPLDLEPELAPALPALDGPTLQAGLARLRELLDDNGGAALKLAARLSREARGSPAEALLSTIAAAAEDYDFEQALRTLQEVESAV